MPLVRFAPSPTGHLHIGNMRTALVNFLFAKANGGQFMLRIDDTDDERSRPEYEESIRADLAWLGIEWDKEDRQSSRLARYREALEELLDSGRAYPCFESPEELALKRKAQLASGRPPVYDRSALNLTADEVQAREESGEKPHYRFKLNDDVMSWQDLVRGEVAVPMSALSDPVILRADGRVIYTLASVVDDLDHGITHILRGEDHTTNSAAQIQLFEALGGTPPRMGHFALLADADGGNLSKRLGSLSIGDLRAEGVEALALASLLARIGTADGIEPRLTMAELVAGFDISRFGRATPRFDAAELAALNRRILALMEFPTVAHRLAALGIDAGADFWQAVKGNIEKLTDAKAIYSMATQAITPVIESPEILAEAVRLLPEGEVTSDTWGEWTGGIMAATGLKGKAVFMPLRLALTGAKSGPELKNLIPLMGRERILARLKGAVA